MMTDDKIKNIFDGFDPALPDAAGFMSRLERSMDLADRLRAEARVSRRRARAAMAAAFAVGIIVGALSVTAFPWLRALISTLARGYAVEWSGSVAWMLIAAATALSGWLAYDFAGMMATVKKQN